MKKPVKKSGFAEGRSASGSSRSSLKEKKRNKQQDVGQDKRLKKLNKAKSDLADVLESMDDPDDFMLEEGDTDENNEKSSRFASDFKRIRKSALNEDFNAESGQRMVLKTLFSMTLDLIPVAEKAFRNTGKEQAGYVVVSLSKQLEELASSLKMLGNVENQSEFIKTTIIAPLFVALVQNLMIQFINLKNTVDTECDKKSAKAVKRELDKMLTDIGKFLDACRESMGANIGSYLAGDMSFLGEEKAGMGKAKRGRRRNE